uniref:Uncharacterized protein n=1 Tax=Myoviridae sp. ct5Xl4 TaxID=2826613 RepID=A0A8S5M1H4_9CAUD|nr:MAG TPA: hypothetical protein [Myoviridae sp. ct5Xl4]
MEALRARKLDLSQAIKNRLNKVCQVGEVNYSSNQQ